MRTGIRCVPGLIAEGRDVAHPGLISRPSVSRAAWRRAQVAVFLTAVTLVSLAPVPTSRQAVADATVYARATVTFPGGVQLRSRGYLDDHCVAFKLPCYAFGGGVGPQTFRPEGTAQARAMQRLAGL